MIDAVRMAVVRVLPAWVVSRLVVLTTLAVAHLTVAGVRPRNPLALARVHQGLLAWDGGWYQSIAAHGYAASGFQSLRFFPVFPMAGRLIGQLPGVGPGIGLVIVANLCALIAMAVLSLLVRRETGDRDLARRSVWLVALAPSAFTLVMGYAEATLLICTSVTLLAIRSDRWWWAVAAGLVAGATRPIGLLLMVPVTIEAYRTRTTKGGRSFRANVARCAAVVAPAAGTAGYLAWVAGTFGDALLPFRVQDQHGHRGPLTTPFGAMWHNLMAVAHGHHVGSALHIPWVLASLALVVLAFRVLPVSYGAFAAAVVAVSIASSNLDSFERYALSAFPLVIAASTLTSRRRVELPVLLGAAIAMAGYAFLAFVGISVP
jgi:hypothetical protein